MSSDAGSSATVATPLPNELRGQLMSNLADSDQWWGVEWGSVAALREEAKANPQHAQQPRANPSFRPSQWQEQPQHLGAQPVFCFVLASVPSAQHPMVPCIVGQYPVRTALTAHSKPFAPAAESKPPLANSGRSKKAVNTATDVTEEEKMPVDWDGVLPSVGSEGHADGSCKRCAFFPKGRCQNGADCTHCHFPHLPRARQRKRGATKADRLADAAIADKAMSEAEEEEVGNSNVAVPQQVVDVLQWLTSSNSDIAAPVPAKMELDDIEEVFVAEVDTTEPSLSALSDFDEITLTSQKESLSEMSDYDQIDSAPPVSKSCVRAAAPTSWAAQQRLRKASKAKELSATDVARMSRGLLNKLTEDRFESLATQLLALPLSTMEQLDAVAAELFEKATTQNGFRFLYAELCTRLDTHVSEQSGAVGGKAFRKALVNQCQATFERNLQPKDAALFADLDRDEVFEAEVKLKNACLGNMRFIGELLVRRLLAPKLMLPIVHELINGDEAALEALIALLTVVAPSFEQRASIVQAPLKDAFATLRRKQTDNGVSTRVRYLISDLLEAHAGGWSPRHA